jgi:predicted metal-dependent hydrolase
MDYEIKPSSKARRIRITIYPDGRVVATKPRIVSELAVRAFVKSKSFWIQQKLDYYKNRKIIRFGSAKSKTKAEALEFVKSRINHYNQHYKFTFGKITIKNHRSVWGSCSARKNLNFNHRIVDLTPEQADYIIVHELCHLKELNHSKRFWSLVAETIPNFRELKHSLRSYSFY